MKRGGARLAHGSWAQRRAALPAVRRRRHAPSCRSAGCCGCRCSRSRSAWRRCCCIGTLNRVMIVELGVPAWLVAADGRAAAALRAVPRADRLPLRHPPLGARLEARALHLVRHAAAVRRPRDHALRADRAVAATATGPAWAGEVARGARLPDGRRRHAHDADRRPGARHRPAPPSETRPRVVALLYVMLLRRHGGLARWSSARCSPTSANLRLIQVVQGAAVVTMVLNIIALWKQEARDPDAAPSAAAPRPGFRDAWAVYRRPRHAPAPARRRRPRHRGLLACRTSCSSPMAARSSACRVGATTMLTALLAVRRASSASSLAARWLGQRRRPATGSPALGAARRASPPSPAVIFAAPLGLAPLFFASAPC